jgi:hypothetical protein
MINLQKFMKNRKSRTEIFQYATELLNQTNESEKFMDQGGQSSIYNGGTIDNMDGNKANESDDNEDDTFNKSIDSD